MDAVSALGLANSVSCWLDRQPLTCKESVHTVRFVDVLPTSEWRVQEWMTEINPMLRANTIALCGVGRYLSLCLATRSLHTAELAATTSCEQWLSSVQVSGSPPRWFTREGFCRTVDALLVAASELPIGYLWDTIELSFWHVDRIRPQPIPPEAILNLATMIHCAVTEHRWAPVTLGVSWYARPKWLEVRVPET